MTNKEITNAYYGTDQVEKIYLGSDVVWPAGSPSHDYSKDYLTFEITSPGNIVWAYSGSTDSGAVRTIEYSKNGGEWVSITSNSGSAGPSFSVTTGDMVRFRGDNRAYGTTSRYSCFWQSTCGFKLKGNIMSLIDSTGFTTATTLQTGSAGNVNVYTFLGLFRGCTGLTDASDCVLPATSIACQGAYRQLFQECTNLVYPPRTLPATSYSGVCSYCYNAMFRDCTSLISAPEFSFATLASGTVVTSCYANMFNGCTSLETAPELPLERPDNSTNTQNIYNGMFQGCTSLINAPSVLPITTLMSGEYSNMFAGCTSLQKSPKILATSIPGNSAANMFSGCTSLNEVFCMATGVASTSQSWLSGVSSNGTFYKGPNATIGGSGIVGIPTTWYIKNYYEDCWNNWQEEGYMDYDSCKCMKHMDCS